MIQINLLPKELRKAEPTPWPKLLALLISLIVILSAGLLMIYYRFNVLPQVLEERRIAEEEKTGLQKRAQEADELDDRIKNHELHEKTILEIRQTRWLWSKKLDQIVDIIPEYIQITSLDIKESKSAGKSSKDVKGPTIEMACLSEGSNERNLADFRRKIISSTLWEDVQDMPEWNYQLNTTKEGQTTLSFKAVLVLKPKLVEKAPAAPKAAKKPARKEAAASE